jgi:hypothetical protein
MKGAAQGFCRPRARRTISRTLELGRHPGACSSCALRGGRASGTGSKPDSSDHRCAERKGCPWLDPSGDDAAKRGRRDGPPVERGRSSRDVQDRDGAFQLLRRARRLLPLIERIADGGYAGNKMRSSSAHAWRLRIIKRFDAAGFEVLPKRWDRQRTFLRGSAAIAAWLGS